MLNSGHVQVRAESFKHGKTIIEMERPAGRQRRTQEKAAGTAGVKAVAPVLWSSGFVDTADEMLGVSVTGIDPESIS